MKSPFCITFQSSLARSDKYRPEIDGLRAIAVLSVLFFHAKVAGFAGGFVGVDIFLVISGYLITSLIAKDLALHRFSFASFYERRMRRIFPALFAVFFSCVLAAILLFSPRDLLDFGRSAIAMTFFVSNIFFKREGGAGGYFDRGSESQALLHTWTLSLEEQFYLFFPVVLFLITRWAKRRTAGWILCLVAISFVANIWTTQHRPLTAFYTLIPRAWELLIGSLLAMEAVAPLKRRFLREIAGMAGLGLIGCAVCVFTKDTSFPGLSVLCPCLGAVLIIYSGKSGPSSVRAILRFPPIVFIGIISYSLYLWHWPILVFCRYFVASTLTGVQTAWAIGASLVMAFISFEFVESPFRGSGSRVTRRQVFSFGLAASIFSIALGLTIDSRQGLPGRYDAQTRLLVYKNMERKTDYEEVCGNWRTDFHSITDIALCKIGPDAPKKIIFLGDSHVQQLYPVVHKIYDEGNLRDHGAIFAIAAGCPLIEHMNAVEKGFHCDSFTRFAMDRAEQEDIDTVFIGFSTWWSLLNDICPSAGGTCVERISPQEQDRRFMQELSQHIQSLKMRGKRVIVSLPFPIFDKSIPDLEIHNAVFGKFGLAEEAADITLPDVRRQVAAIAETTGADLFDPRNSLCRSGKCITEIGGVSIYRDDNHIVASQVGILKNNLRQVLR